MNMRQAKHFLAVWTLASSVEVAAAALDRPVLTVLRMARYLRKRGVDVRYRPIEEPTKQSA